MGVFSREIRTLSKEDTRKLFAKIKASGPTKEAAEKMIKIEERKRPQLKISEAFYGVVRKLTICC